jgi:hypothetical protein
MAFTPSLLNPSIVISAVLVTFAKWHQIKDVPPSVTSPPPSQLFFSTLMISLFLYKQSLGSESF